MAEGDDSVAHLEQGLKRIWGPTKNANRPKSSELTQKGPDTVQQGILNQYVGVDGSVANGPKVSLGKNQESTPKRRQNPRVRHNKRSEAPSSSTTTEDTGKVKVNASETRKNDGGQEKNNHAINTNHSKQQSLPNQLTTFPGFIRDRRWHPDDEKTKTSSKRGTKGYNRTASNEEIPQNWRQNAPKMIQAPRKTITQVLCQDNGTVVEESSLSLSEIVPHNVKDPAPVVNSFQHSRKGEGAKARSKEKIRLVRETSKKERVDLAQLASEYDEVPKHLQELNYPTGIVPLTPPIVSQRPAVLPEEKKNVTQAVEARHDDIRIPHVAVPDEEEMVQIVVLPTLAQQKRRKPAKNEKKDEPKKTDDDSSSSSSSSSEEEPKPRRNEIQQPLLFNIRKNELNQFRKSGVLPLKHISPKFPRAVFHCRLCSFHISSIPEVYRHTRDERHVRLQKQETSRQTASLMPSPPPEIVEVIGQFIQDIFHCSGLTKEDLEIRRVATENLRKMIETAFPGLSIRPYGSVVTGMFTLKKKIFCECLRFIILHPIFFLS